MPRCNTYLLDIVLFEQEQPYTKNRKEGLVDDGIGCTFGVTINQLLFFKGLELATPISTSIIMTCTPIIVLVVAIFMIKERLTWQKILGLIFGLSGATTSMLSGCELSTAQAPNPTLGNLLIFLNAISYATYLVISKRLIHKYNAIVFMKWVFLLGITMVIPFGFDDVFDARWTEMSHQVLWSIGFILFFVSCLTY